jgi:hypothetical protein
MGNEKQLSPAPQAHTSSPGTKILLICLLVTAVFAAGWIRMVDLQSNPPGLWQDEASTGLDAYLIWTTGSDRAKSFLPLISKSFGDYPLAGYRYLTAPIVGLGGLSIGNERLTASIIGFLMVLLTAWLVRRTTHRHLAFFTLISAGICPTWIHFSRYGSEAILLPFCLVAGFALFERGKKQAGYLWLGTLSLAASAYTYHAVKLVLPLWMVAFLIYHWPLIKKLWVRQKKHIIGPAILFALCVFPSVWMALTTEGMARGRTVLAWHHYSGWKLIRVVLNNYLSYLDFGLLFVRGGPAVAQSIPGLGLWNLIELPFVLVGIFQVFRPSPYRRFYFFVLAWFLLGPLPGGVTYETENIGRVIAWLPAPQILSAIGMTHLYHAWQKLREHQQTQYHGIKKSAAMLIAVLFVGGWVATYAQVFYLTLVSYPQTTKRDWQFEISRAMQCAKAKRKDEEIIVSPNFQAVHTFAHFHLYDVKSKENKTKPGWRIAQRRKVGAHELYVSPAKGAKPIGRKICTISLKSKPMAYVYAGKTNKPPLKHPKPSNTQTQADMRPGRPFPQLPIRTQALDKVAPVQGPKPQHR